MILRSFGRSKWRIRAAGAQKSVRISLDVWRIPKDPKESRHCLRMLRISEGRQRSSGDRDTKMRGNWAPGDAPPSDPPTFVGGRRKKASNPFCSLHFTNFRHFYDFCHRFPASVVRFHLELFHSYCIKLIIQQNGRNIIDIIVIPWKYLCYLDKGCE